MDKDIIDIDERIIKRELEEKCPVSWYLRSAYDMDVVCMFNGDSFKSLRKTSHGVVPFFII